MNILIDTNILYRLTIKDDPLSKKAIEILNDVESKLFLSYFSIFELSIKAAKGKITYNHEDLLSKINLVGIEVILPSIDLFKGYKIFNPNNKDPFDNILIATAIDNKLTFMTSDKRISDTSEKGLDVIYVSS